MSEETTALEETTAPLGPPESTLFYGGREVNGAIGTYSWGDSGGGIIADSFVIPVPPKKQTLIVPSGSETVFRYGKQRPPNKVSATAYTLLAKENATGTRLRTDRSLNVHGSGVERTIPAELPPGEYVVSVEVAEPKGDVEYTFRLVVE